MLKLTRSPGGAVLQLYEGRAGALGKRVNSPRTGVPFSVTLSEEGRRGFCSLGVNSTRERGSLLKGEGRGLDSGRSRRKREESFCSRRKRERGLYASAAYISDEEGVRVSIPEKRRGSLFFLLTSSAVLL